MFKIYSTVFLFSLEILSLHRVSTTATAEAKILNSQDKNAYLDTWKPPQNLSTNCPYYVSGFDAEKRPVFIMEIGKWPIRYFVEKGGQELKDFSKYIEQMFHRIELGPKTFFNETEQIADGSVIIADWADFSLTQFIHGPTTQFILNHFTLFQKIQDSLVYGYFVNANAVASQLMNLARPILGSIMERMEIYGTQKHQWIPKILRKIPKDQLPSWYGGVEDFKPLVVYG